MIASFSQILVNGTELNERTSWYCHSLVWIRLHVTGHSFIGRCFSSKWLTTKGRIQNNFNEAGEDEVPSSSAQQWLYDLLPGYTSNELPPHPEPARNFQDPHITTGITKSLIEGKKKTPAHHHCVIASANHTPRMSFHLTAHSCHHAVVKPLSITNCVSKKLHVPTGIAPQTCLRAQWWHLNVQ